jgi:hypothetical protein
MNLHTISIEGMNEKRERKISNVTSKTDEGEGSCSK